MYDSHAHLTISPLDKNTERHVKDFLASGGKQILNVAYDPESLNQVVQQHNKLNSLHPKSVLTGLGIHPEYFSNGFGNDGFSLFDKAKRVGDLIEEHVNDNIKIVTAIGETGLDYYHIFNDSSIKNTERDEIIEVQKRSFKKHVELALKHNLPLTIHTRDLEGQDQAVVDAMQIVSDLGKGRIRGSFHSYTGSIKHISSITDLGFYIGFNGIITYPSADNVRELLKEVPLERVLVETDSPLLPPQSVRSNRKSKVKYATPADTKEILQSVAEIRGLTYQKAEEITDENFQRLFLTD